MDDVKELLREFVDFLEYCGEDAFYVFENTEEAIISFLEGRDKDE